jgi:hypothetical protein
MIRKSLGNRLLAHQEKEAGNSLEDQSFLGSESPCTRPRGIPEIARGPQLPGGLGLFATVGA